MLAGVARFDVCVVGAGVVGLNAALQLQRRGQTVAVIDRDHPGAGSSGLSVGVVGSQRIVPLEIELRAWSLRFLAGLEQFGLEVNRIGYLRLGRSAEAIAAFEESVALQRAAGCEAEVVDAARLQSLVPHLRCDDLAGGLYGPDNGFVDGHQYCSVLAERLLAAGGRVLARHRLLGAERPGSGGHRLVTDADAIDCDAVVIAAGAWSGQVAGMLGVTIEIVPTRHVAAIVGLGAPLPYRMPMVMDYVPGFGGTGLNFRHERPGQLVTELHTGALTPVDPDGYARIVDVDELEPLAALLLDRLPTLRDATLGRAWSGLYPDTPGGQPVVGPLDREGTIIAAAGVGGYGIQLSPAIGALAADWVIDRSPTTIPAARVLAPDRR